MASKKDTTVEDLKSIPTPKSPRKYSQKLTCAVLNKSPLKATRHGQMFSLNLCDKDVSSTIRAVCFNANMFDKFETSKTYELKEYKIKKGYGSSNDVELLIDSQTVVEKAATELAMKDCIFTISQILRGGSANVRFMNLKAKVTSVGELETVGQYPDQKTKREVSLADNTGHINLVLWRERADNASLKEGDVLTLTNVVLSSFNNRVSLTTSFETAITKIEEEMAICSAPRPTKRSNVTSLQSMILAVKEFTCTFKCVGCRTEVSSTADPLLTCPACSAEFLKIATAMNNQCKFLLANNQWFSANTRVIQHLFQWYEPKMAPSREEIINLLSGKFSFRLDLDRKVIEHAIACVDEDPAVLASLDDMDGLVHNSEAPTDSPKKKRSSITGLTEKSIVTFSCYQYGYHNCYFWAFYLHST